MRFFPVSAFLLVLVSNNSIFGQLINLEPPPEGVFVIDNAQMLSDEEKEKINKISGNLLKQNATPIIVVTIEGMAKYGGTNMRIETFAMLLFNQWGIGHEKIDGKPWNTGILLLVSEGDRKARIELGAGWKREKDEQCQQIMDGFIIPQFKQGNFGAGITAGVEALDKMAQGLEIPRPPTPWWVYVVIIGFIGLAIFTVVSLIRSGASGWAWLFWAAVFGIVGYLLYQMMTSRGSSGGGFSGGSFGGGFSGGGGATGGW